MTVWILWSLLFATLVALAALSAERVAAHYAWPRRFIWMVAIAACAVVPAVLAVRPTRTVRVDRTAGSPTIVQPGPEVKLTAIRSPLSRSAGGVALNGAELDAWAIRVWLILSVAVVATFVRAILTLRRQRATWREADLGPCRALIATDIGPAVIGFLRPRVVVPEWALSVDEPTRRMILLHEIEHLRAGDPRALLASGIILVALPWNLALWWIVRRLRLAMELDCDARVVRCVGRSYDYASVLLAVGERYTMSLPLAASLTGRRPFLERRIIAMMTKKVRRPFAASLPFAAFAVVAMTAATRTPHPDPLRVISFAPATQPYPTRDAIAAMMLANVPALGSAQDSSNYAVLVLDANNEFVTATAGYGNLMVKVWGDTLDNDARELRTAERTGIPVSGGDVPGGGARRGGAGAGGGGAGGGARAGGAGSGAGGGAQAGGAGSGGNAGSDRGEIPPGAVRLSQWLVSRPAFLPQAAGEAAPPMGPGHGYAAGFIYERGPDPVTGMKRMSQTNEARGLHPLSRGNSDDSGIDGIPASRLTSLETYHFRGEIGGRNVSVIVVTTNTGGAVR
jgi:beta-lactamase regulating signal transducer with metallopeptidase domain